MESIYYGKHCASDLIRRRLHDVNNGRAAIRATLGALAYRLFGGNRLFANERATGFKFQTRFFFVVVVWKFRDSDGRE